MNIEEEIKKIIAEVALLKAQVDVLGQVQESCTNEITAKLEELIDKHSPADDGEEISDDMYAEARKVVIEAGRASTSYIQRKLRIGYARAARLMDMLEEEGVIEVADGAKPRKVLLSE